MATRRHYRDEHAIQEFGKRVRKLRQGKGVTIEQFANEVGLQVTQLARIERGEVNCSISYIFRIADVLKVKASSLIDFD